MIVGPFQAMMLSIMITPESQDSKPLSSSCIESLIISLQDMRSDWVGRLLIHQCNSPLLDS